MSEHLTKLGKRLKELLDKKKECEDAEKKIGIEIERLQGQFVEAMELHKLQNFTIKDLGKFFLHSSIYPKIKDKEVLFADLRARGAEDLIKETVYPSTLRAYVKECIDQKNEVPQGVEVHSKTTVRVRKI